MLEPGLSCTVKVQVTTSQTALSMGSGDLPVFATPAMVALMEQAAMKAVAPFLPEGSTTVGCMVECTHLAPTPLGEDVEATAVLECIEGRKLHFRIFAKEGDKLLGEGSHTRVVVDLQKFMERIQQG